MKSFLQLKFLSYVILSNSKLTSRSKGFLKQFTWIALLSHSRGHDIRNLTRFSIGTIRQK